MIHHCDSSTERSIISERTPKLGPANGHESSSFNRPLMNERLPIPSDAVIEVEIKHGASERGITASTSFVRSTDETCKCVTATITSSDAPCSMTLTWLKTRKILAS